MLIAKAYAQAVDIGSDMAQAAPEAPSAGATFMWNMGLVMVMVVLFYFLLIRPQQKRFREHSVMLSGLKKGDRVVTGGGLIGTIDKITDGKDEVLIDLGGMKVTALRSTLQGKNDPRLKAQPANDAPAPDTKTKKK